MNKKLIITTFGLTLFLSACSQTEDWLAPPSEVNDNPEEFTLPTAGENDYEVTSTEISNIAKAHGARNSRSESYTVSPILGENGNATMYVINYGTNSGWQIVSASKNLHPILAFSDEGHFDVKDLPNMPFGLSNWIDNASIMVEQSYTLDADSVQKVRVAWHQYEANNGTSRSGARDYDPRDILKYISQEEYDRLVAIMNDSIMSWHNQGYEVQICDADYMDENPEFFDEALSTIFGPYTDAVCQLTFKLHKEWGEDYREQLIKSIWQQNDPYNQSFGPVNDTVPHAAVGCVPLAIGQIMRYFQFPNSFDWSDMPLDSATITTSNFLYNIARQVDAKFLPNSTTTDYRNAKALLDKYGYKTSDFMSYNKYSRLPSIGFMRAKITIKDIYKYIFSGDSHAWVIGGRSSVVEWRQTIFYSFRSRLMMDTFSTPGWPEEVSHHNYAYMVWGFKPFLNGFYSESAISCPLASKLEDIKYLSVELPK